LLRRLEYRRGAERNVGLTQFFIHNRKIQIIFFPAETFS